MILLFYKLHERFDMCTTYQVEDLCVGNDLVLGWCIGTNLHNLQPLSAVPKELLQKVISLELPGYVPSTLKKEIEKELLIREIKTSRAWSNSEKNYFDIESFENYQRPLAMDNDWYLDNFNNVIRHKLSTDYTNYIHASDAFIYFLYLTKSYYQMEIDTIPTFLNSKRLKYIKPTVNELLALAPSGSKRKFKAIATEKDQFVCSRKQMVVQPELLAMEYGVKVAKQKVISTEDKVKLLTQILSSMVVGLTGELSCVLGFFIIRKYFGGNVWTVISEGKKIATFEDTDDLVEFILRKQ